MQLRQYTGKLAPLVWVLILGIVASFFIFSPSYADCGCKSKSASLSSDTKSAEIVEESNEEVEKAAQDAKDSKEVIEQTAKALDDKTVVKTHKRVLAKTKTMSKREVIYRQYCVHCHAVDAPIQVNAPEFRDVDAWKYRMKVGVKKLRQRLESAEGYENMPARGGCFECSDEDLEEVIAYMLPKTRENDS